MWIVVLGRCVCKCCVDEDGLVGVCCKSVYTKKNSRSYNRGISNVKIIWNSSIITPSQLKNETIDK